MKTSHAARVAVCGIWLLGTGCTALKEIPRSEYTSQAERKNVRIHTKDGLVYEFDHVRVEADTLVGFRRQEAEGAFDEFASMRMPLEDITQLSSRGVDWYRTGLIGGGVLAAVVAAGLNAASRNSGEDPSSGGGKIGVP